MRYVGLRNYDKNKLCKLLANIKVDAIVLGDPFCQKRMFCHGEYDLFSYFEQVWEAGKEVIYQTPCFATDRELEGQKQILAYLAQRRKTWVLVQDIGMASMICQYYPSLNMCWSQYGKTRIDVINLKFIEFLKKLNIFCMEVDNEKKIYFLQNTGMIPFYNYRSIVYQSIGRVCYSCYETECEIYNCNRKCLKERLYLYDREEKRSLSLDGYILNERYRVNELLENFDMTVGIYGEDLLITEEAMKQWEVMERCRKKY